MSLETLGLHLAIGDHVDSKHARILSAASGHVDDIKQKKVWRVRVISDSVVTAGQAVDVDRFENSHPSVNVELAWDDETKSKFTRRLVVSSFIPKGTILHAGQPFCIIDNTYDVIPVQKRHAFASHVSTLLQWSFLKKKSKYGYLDSLLSSCEFNDLFPRSIEDMPALEKEIANVEERLKVDQSFSIPYITTMEKLNGNAIWDHDNDRVMFFDVVSCVNHSCSPNSRRLLYNVDKRDDERCLQSDDERCIVKHSPLPLLYILSCDDMGANEEVTVCYDDRVLRDDMYNDVHKRRAYLAEMFHFDCVCVLCKKQLADDLD